MENVWEMVRGSLHVCVMTHNSVMSARVFDVPLSDMGQCVWNAKHTDSAIGDLVVAVLMR